MPAASPDFADWDGLLGLIRRSFAYMDGVIDPPSSAHRLTAATLAEKAQSEHLLLLERPLRACAFLAPQADALHVGKLAVDPALQGRGLGRALMDEAEALARSLRLPRLRLQTRVELTGNHAAFARMGFVQTAATAHPGHHRPTSITMEKPVGGLGQSAPDA